MAPPSRARTLPQAMTSPMLGELLSAELEELIDPPAVEGEQRPRFDATPTARARRQLLTGFVSELRAYHAAEET